MYEPILKVCLFCKQTFNARRGRELPTSNKKIYCSRGCLARHRATWIHGKNHHNWKHGLKIDKDRYISTRTYLGPHRKHTTKGLHRILMERYLNRELLQWEEVHHVDGNKHNNQISNLIVLSKEDHASLHGLQRGILNGLATI